jgi:hypothetical protein
MSLPSFSPSAHREGFRPRVDRDDASSVQLNIDDNTIRRLRIRTARFPVSFSRADESALRSEVPKSAYYALIARAVSQLPNNTRAARLALYERAEIALTGELLDPEISDEQAGVERLSFERAIRRIEGDARKKENLEELQQSHPRPFPSFLSFFRLLKRRYV